MHLPPKGITPAYAGQILTNGKRQCRPWDHPRLRRTNTKPNISCHDCPGITPAYAGQICIIICAPATKRDHPRLRRTNDNSGETYSITKGSPPLTQDKFIKNGKVADILGITPAYAGQIRSRDRAQPFDWDHPRLRRTNRLPIARF